MASNPTDSEAKPDVDFDVSYWPSFKPILAEHRERFIHEHMTCSICMQPLTPERNETVPNTGICHGIDILPCGHVFGAKCIDVWLKGAEEQRCPACRAPATHPKCGHAVERYPLQVPVDTILVPLTVPEGGKLPDTHTGCNLHLYLMFIIEKVADCITQEWLSEVSDTLVVRVNYTWGRQEDFVFDLEYHEHNGFKDIDVTLVHSPVAMVPLECPLFPNDHRAVPFDVRLDEMEEN